MLTCVHRDLWKYFNLSETSPALSKSMLPWQMFSFDTRLAEGGSEMLYSRNCIYIALQQNSEGGVRCYAVEIVYTLLSNRALRLAGWATLPVCTYLICLLILNRVQCTV